MPTGRPPEEIKTEDYVKAFDWLHEFSLSPEYVELQRAYALLKPRMWEAYKANGITGLREQRVLEAAQIAIRKRWKRNRPSFFGRIYKQKEEGDASDSQSSST